MYSIKISNKPTEELLKELGGTAKKQIALALNRAMDMTKTEAEKQITGSYNKKKKKDGEIPSHKNYGLLIDLDVETFTMPFNLEKINEMS